MHSSWCSATHRGVAAVNPFTRRFGYWWVNRLTQSRTELKVWNGSGSQSEAGRLPSMTMNFGDDSPMDDAYREIYESDRDFIHDAARKGVTLEGKKLPREIDEQGRVWVKCRCGEKFLLEEDDDE